MIGRIGRILRQVQPMLRLLCLAASISPGHLATFEAERGDQPRRGWYWLDRSALRDGARRRDTLVQGCEQAFPPLPLDSCIRTRLRPGASTALVGRRRASEAVPRRGGNAGYLEIADSLISRGLLHGISRRPDGNARSPGETAISRYSRLFPRTSRAPRPLDIAHRCWR